MPYDTCCAYDDDQKFLFLENFQGTLIFGYDAQTSVPRSQSLHVVLSFTYIHVCHGIFDS